MIGPAGTEQQTQFVMPLTNEQKMLAALEQIVSLLTEVSAKLDKPQSLITTAGVDVGAAMTAAAGVNQQRKKDKR